MKSRRPVTQIHLPGSEWDFRNVWDSEVIACYYYEFAREVRTKLVPKVEELRELSSPGSKLLAKIEERTSNLSSKDILEMILPHLGSAEAHALDSYSFLWFPEWPQMPYQETKRHRRERVESTRRKPSDEQLAARLRPIPPSIYLSENDCGKLNHAKTDPKED
jgi:hypothetical protein